MASNVIYVVTVLIITVCFLTLWHYSGFFHEDRKFKAILVSFMVVLLFQFLIFDPIRFFLQAADAAFWPKPHQPYMPDSNAQKHNHMDYLNLRLRSLRSQLLVTERHRNEELNLKYRTIVQELWVYGKVFLIHLFLNMMLVNQLLYYNADSIIDLMTYNTTKSIGFSDVIFLHNLYPFIEHTLINGLSSNERRLESNWHHVNGTKLLGVVRMRLLRETGGDFGLDDPEYSEREYSQGWTEPHIDETYTDKRWSIYLPWLPMDPRWGPVERFYLNFKQYGFFANYPELKGYVVKLRKSKDESIKVLTYLYENNWFDVRTAAVFFDFTLYNVDANMFSVCSIRCENLPFGIIRCNMYVNSGFFTDTIETLPWIGMICLVVYTLIWLELGAAVIVPLWFEPKRFTNIWVIVDLMILMLSLSVVSLLVMRERAVTQLLDVLEVSSEQAFMDFRIPARMTEFTVMLMGFLVCLVTLRLWKVMQFASIFQIFTMTLSLAWKALFSTASVIVIFMMGFGIATVGVNGNHNENFRTLGHGMATVMRFSFGFTNQVEPEDLFHGGKLLGIVAYATMAFTVSIMLTNVFVSILNNYFTAAKTIRDRNRKNEISFWEFLRVEYADSIRVIREAFGCEHKYRHKNRTVAENIKHALDLQAAALASVRTKRGIMYRIISQERKEVNTDLEEMEQERKAQEVQRDRIAKTYTIAAILQTQMEIAERKLFGDLDGNLLDDSDEDSGPAESSDV